MASSDRKMEEGLLRFNADLKKFAKIIDADLELVMQKVALDVFTGVVQRTPVDTGTARASWTIGLNVVDTQVVKISGGKLSLAAASSVANQQRKKLKQIKAYSTVYISNNVPYIQKLEYGSSTQAPEGMVRVTMSEVEAGIVRLIQSV